MLQQTQHSGLTIADEEEGIGIIQEEEIPNDVTLRAVEGSDDHQDIITLESDGPFLEQLIESKSTISSVYDHDQKKSLAILEDLLTEDSHDSLHHASSDSFSIDAFRGNDPSFKNDHSVRPPRPPVFSSTTGRNTPFLQGISLLNETMRPAIAISTVAAAVVLDPPGQTKHIVTMSPRRECNSANFNGFPTSISTSVEFVPSLSDDDCLIPSPPVLTANSGCSTLHLSLPVASNGIPNDKTTSIINKGAVTSSLQVKTTSPRYIALQ
mmetsp:Transcript_34568/g.37304  ORF Transcript_34568/g.37304 Transcript_34568/m.37304 type:complete len:267 (+) Transcript_34568:346-1146(+)